MNKYTFESKLWRSEGPSGWHFVTLSVEMSEEIRSLYKDISPGFGSIPVKVTLNKSKWETSVFYDTMAHAFLLPIKGVIRKKEKVKEDELLNVSIEIVL